jgi:hypothetical protein
MPVTADPPKSTGTRSGLRWFIASMTRCRFDPIFFTFVPIFGMAFIARPHVSSKAPPACARAPPRQSPTAP